MECTDGPSVHSVVHIEAAVPRARELVTDIRLPARFSPELRRVARLDGANGPVVGARFEGIKTLAEESGRSGWEAVVRRRSAPVGHGLICR
ncbi:hypothetical protein ACFVRD_09045 [Streptomyces sp. NPDC057908]|uniref:hypothetical protein n=1 Tax=Streptomyces sp. NPDC057908 TaxID=3346276 RepID=UPI0036EB73F5